MSRYALIDNSTHRVTNVMEWGGDTNAWTPPAGYTAVQTNVGNVGDSYDGANFTPSAPIPPTAEETAVAQAVALLKSTFQTSRTVGQVNNCIDAITLILRRIKSDLAP